MRAWLVPTILFAALGGAFVPLAACSSDDAADGGVSGAGGAGASSGSGGNTGAGGDASIAAAPHGDVQVGGGDAQGAISGIEEDVRKDRNGVLPFDDPLDQVELLDEVGLADDGLHS